MFLLLFTEAEHHKSLCFNEHSEGIKLSVKTHILYRQNESSLEHSDLALDMWLALVHDTSSLRDDSFIDWVCAILTSS